MILYYFFLAVVTILLLAALAYVFVPDDLMDAASLRLRLVRGRIASLFIALVSLAGCGDAEPAPVQFIRGSNIVTPLREHDAGVDADSGACCANAFAPVVYCDGALVPNADPSGLPTCCGANEPALDGGPCP